jgi:hypothetical protein
MPNLETGLEAHLKRLEFDAEGFKLYPPKLLGIYQSGIRSKPAIYQSFWQTEKIYGMGDSQLDIYLQQLADKKLISLQ